MELNKTAKRHATDTKHLLQIFPVEIWTKILEHLENSTNLLNAWQSSNFFRDMLNHQRQFFLFPKVWEILGLKYEQSNDLSYRQKDLPKLPDNEVQDTTRHPVTCTACGTIRKTRWFSGILSLRLVCKTWSQAITSFYENIPQYFQQETHPKSQICKNTHWSQTFLIELAETIPSRFLRHFRETHEGDVMNRSPFLGSMLTVVYGYGGTNGRIERRLLEFISGVTALTKKYGRHVRTLNLYECGGVCNTTSNYTIIHDLLHSMRFLETLRVSERRTEKFPLKMVQLITNAICGSPLPYFPWLQFLTVETLNARILREIIRQNCHITKLEMTEERNRSMNYILEKHLPRLQELSIKINQCGIDFEDLEHFQISWPLTKLCLNFHHLYATDWTRVLGVVGRWKDTLTDLVLVMPRSDQTPTVNWADGQLQMKKIKNLKLVLPNYYTLDFILSVKDNLEFLEVRVPRLKNEHNRKSQSFAAEMDSKIKLLSFSKNPLDSNVWQFCPKLRKIDYYEVLENSVNENDNFKIWSYKRLDWVMRQN